MNQIKYGLRQLKLFTERDTATSPPVAIVNERFARRFNVTEVGRRLGFGASTTNYPFEIVGIVADSRHGSVKGETEPVVYLSRHLSAPNIQAMFYYLRAGVDPESLLTTIRRVVAQIDPDVPVTNLKTMVTTVQESVYVDRLLSMLSAGFAALGLVAALALGRVAEALLFGLSGRDPLVLAAAAAVLAAVVLAGAWLPARRAARIAPTEALRYE